MGYEVENHSRNRMRYTRNTPNPTLTTSIVDLRIGLVRNEAVITQHSDYEEYPEN